MNLREYQEMYALEDAYWWFVGRRAFIRRIMDRLPPARTTRRILDLGCGTGANLQLLGRYGTSYGLDYGNHALRLASTRADGSRLVEGTANRLPFPNETFDIVTCLDVFEHLADDIGAMAEVRRVLTSEGRLVLTVPAYRWLWSEHDEALGHFRRYSRSQLLQHLRAAHLCPLSVRFAICLPLFPAAALRLLQRWSRATSQRPAQTAHLRLPGPMNRLLIAYLNLEATLVDRWPLPFGISLLAAVGKRTN